MKKLLLPLMLFASVLLLFNSALAYNLLQLDIANDGASYDPSNQTIVTADPTFDLVALLNPLSGEFGNLTNGLSTTFNIVASWNTLLDASFTIGGNTVDLDEGLLAPTNPQLNHGELGTYAKLIPFTFNTLNTTTPYNTQTNSGGFAGYVDPNVDPNATFIYETFAVNLSGLDPFEPIHFDLFAYTGGNPEKVFAPFSHDASAVPEPTTMLLLGSGLLGLAGFRRKFRKG